LHAYKANNLAQECWKSAQATNKSDQAGKAVKLFLPPSLMEKSVWVLEPKLMYMELRPNSLPVLYRDLSGERPSGAAVAAPTG
jgi:hypothetical protein